MAKVNLFWNPAGFELDSLGTNQLTKVSDGDTPQVSFSIRMLSIDTPEIHYPGTQSPAKHDEKLTQLAEWMQQGKAPIDAALADFLRPKLATGSAGSVGADCFGCPANPRPKPCAGSRKSAGRSPKTRS